VWRPGLEYHLHLRYTTSTPAIIRTVFSFTDPAGGTHSSAEVVAVPTANDRPADLHVPLRLGSTQPPALTGIRLLLPGNATLSIAAAELEVRQRPPGAAAAWAWSPVGEPYPQRFDLFRLPNIWANLDAHDPVHTARELQTLHAGDAIAVAPGHDHVFSVQPVDMASGQYLHLRMQADTPATVTVGYGDATHPNTFSMQVQASPEPQDYLIRLSTQWEWERGTVTALRLSASAPVRLDALRVLAGD